MSARAVRLAALLDAIRARPGRWTAGRLHRLRRRSGGPVQRGTARRDLARLADAGYLTAHGPDDGRYYLLRTTR